MLDEVREYQEYMELSASRRLESKGFEQNCYFSGIGRALTVIARGALFAPEASGLETREERAAAARGALLRWCGFPEDRPPEKDELLSGPLTDFMSAVYPKASDEMRKKLKSKWKQWNVLHPGPRSKASVSGKGRKAKESENDYNAIYFWRILADAMEAGPLKRRYLAVEGEPFEGWALYKEDKQKEGKKLCDYQDAVLKATAAYLLRRSVPGREYAVFSAVDYANWLRKRSPNAFIQTLYSFRLRPPDGERELFLQHTVVNDNIVKIRCLPRWVNRFSLLDEQELDAALSKNPSLVFYSDGGTGIPLQKNTRYGPL